MNQKSGHERDNSDSFEDDESLGQYEKRLKERMQTEIDLKLLVSKDSLKTGKRKRFMFYPDEGFRTTWDFILGM